MPSLEYFLVAESVSSDVQRNTISISNVLSEIRVDAFPAPSIGGVTAVSGWISSPEEVRDKTESQLKLIIRTPTNQDGWVFRASLKSEVKYQNYSFVFRAVPATEPGEMIFELLKDDLRVATHTLTISGPD